MREILCTEDELREMIRDVFREQMPAQSAPFPPAEIIDGDELCKRLSLSLNTVVRYRRKGKIPFLLIGDSIRYNWQSVLKAIEK